MSKKILFIVEGEDDEVEFIRYYFDRLKIDQEYSVFRYGCNIYNFYDCLLANQPDGDFRDLEIQTVLKEAAFSTKRRLPKGQDISLLDESYTDIFLVFDLDNHDSSHTRAEKEKILRALSSSFVESTDTGLLIINSPMVEAYRDLSVANDNRVMINPDIPISESRRYKETVGKRNTMIPPLTKYSKDSFLITSRLHYEKLCLLLGIPFNRQSIFDFRPSALLDVIKSKEDGLLPIVGCISIVPFYFSPRVLEAAIKVPTNRGFHALRIAKPLRGR